MAATLVPGTRWDCGGCTACCRYFALGPVRDEVIARLEALDIGSAWQPAKDGFATRRAGPDGTEGWFLQRREDGACIFLRQDGLCAVHALHGAEAKPSFCQEYPFMVLDEPADDDAGSVRHTVVVRADCGGWAASSATGSDAGPQAETVLALNRAHPAGRFTLDPVLILPGMAASRASFHKVEAALDTPLRAPHGAEHAAHAAAAALYALIDRERPPPDPAHAEAAAHHVVRALSAALGPAVAQAPGDDPERRGMHAMLARSLALLERGRALQRVPLPPAAAAHLAMVLRNELAGRLFQTFGGIPAWLGSFVVGARLAANVAQDDTELTAHGFGEALADWVRLTRHPVTQRLLDQLRDPLTQVFLHATPLDEPVPRDADRS